METPEAFFFSGYHRATTAGAPGRIFMKLSEVERECIDLLGGEQKYPSGEGRLTRSAEFG